MKRRQPLLTATLSLLLAGCGMGSTVVNPSADLMTGKSVGPAGSEVRSLTIQGLQTYFKKYDLDHDGKWARDHDMEGYVYTHAAHYYPGIDKNNDAFVALDEWIVESVIAKHIEANTADANRYFNGMDRNQDGFVSKSEYLVPSSTGATLFITSVGGSDKKLECFTYAAGSDNKLTNPELLTLLSYKDSKGYDLAWK